MEVRKYRFKNLPFKKSREVIYAENRKNNRIYEVIKRFWQTNDGLPDSPKDDLFSKIYHTNGRVFWLMSFLGRSMASNEIVQGKYKITERETK